MDTFSKLKQFDAYPKTLEDFRVKTWGGVTGERVKFSSEQQPFIHSLLAARASHITNLLNSTWKQPKDIKLQAWHVNQNYKKSWR